MPQTINIILSDALFERLEKLIGLAVKTDDTKLNDREAAIARLRIEAKQALERWYKRGHSEGLGIARELSFDQFQQVIGWNEMKNADSDQPIRLFDCVPSNAFLFTILDLVRIPGYVIDDYVFGVIDGIVEFWEDIEDELDPIE